MQENLNKILVERFQLAPETLGPEASFEELGMDSLDLVELALMIEKDLGVRITDDELVEAGTPALAADLIHNRTVGT